ncbi:site-specific integrase [Pseudoalteromonas sp. 1CM17D]|uniref:site-specific integrase n=1 Tax=Pseudoalteromonas sp. 1CM17D TaxID=2929162 RepID=UPI0020BF3488|nr:site-specific integrase [Pseudoalteromonas sp. 1CM17D]MCK8095276.1 site-specific integrase [Pseudoalteromonas sp. 1CM17D]
MELSKFDRITLITHIKDSYADISTNPLDESSSAVLCHDGVTNYFSTPCAAFNENHDVYLFPFTFEKDGVPWEDANHFLFESARNNKPGYRTDTALKEKASMLLDYKIFCEQRKIDLLKFIGRKPNRPTYIYFFDLLKKVNDGELTRTSLNKKTKVVYDFYEFISSKPNSNVDLRKVDTVESVTRFFQNSYGHSYSKKIVKRGQSVAVSSSASPIPVGYVRESSEDLRPLLKPELDELLLLLNTKEFSVDERLMHFIALQTGARKQTILTIRMKHLNLFKEENILKDRTFKVHAGPGTGIDTKFDKPQVLYFPEQLAKQLLIYSKSTKAKQRRDKFITKNGSTLSDDDMYFFLSPQGEPHYMAKSDPRYKITKSKPQGRNTYYMKLKVEKFAGANYPRNFTFHWLRATYAYYYYQRLQPLVAKGVLMNADIISMVQRRLHHASREVTESYLRLFDMVVDSRVAAQSIYEQQLFGLYDLEMDAYNE